jgi:hypothetical protein
VVIRGKVFSCPNLPASASASSDIDEIVQNYKNLKELDERAQQTKQRALEDERAQNAREYFAAMKIGSLIRMLLGKLRRKAIQAALAKNATRYTIDEAVSMIQKAYRYHMEHRNSLWAQAVKNMRSVTKIQSLARGKKAKDITTYKRARRNSGLLKWDIVKARMREIVKRHEQHLQVLSAAKRAKQNPRKGSAARRRKENKEKEMKRQQGLGGESDEELDEQIEIEDLTQASVAKVRRARMRRSSYSYVLAPTQNSLQAFLSVSAHRMVFSGNYILKGRAAFITFYIVGDDHEVNTKVSTKVNTNASRGFDAATVQNAAPWMRTTTTKGGRETTKQAPEPFNQQQVNGHYQRDHHEGGEKSEEEEEHEKDDEEHEKWRYEQQAPHQGSVHQDFELLMVISYYHDQVSGLPVCQLIQIHSKY